MAQPKAVKRGAPLPTMTRQKAPTLHTAPTAARNSRSVRQQTAGPRSGSQKGLQRGRASSLSWNTARRKAASRAPQPPSGFDIGKAIGDFLNPSRQASGIVPRTLQNLPKGGVRGVVKDATKPRR